MDVSDGGWGFPSHSCSCFCLRGEGGGGSEHETDTGFPQAFLYPFPIAIHVISGTSFWGSQGYFETATIREDNRLSLPPERGKKVDEKNQNGRGKEAGIILLVGRTPINLGHSISRSANLRPQQCLSCQEEQVSNYDY